MACQKLRFNQTTCHAERLLSSSLTLMANTCAQSTLNKPGPSSVPGCCCHLGMGCGSGSMVSACVRKHSLTSTTVTLNLEGNWYHHGQKKMVCQFIFSLTLNTMLKNSLQNSRQNFSQETTIFCKVCQTKQNTFFHV